MYYILVCVCMLARACVRACMWVPGRVGVYMRIRAYSLANPGRNAYASYCDVHYIFRHYFINGAIFGKKKNIEHKMCFYFLYNFRLKHFSFLKEFSEISSKMSKRLHVKYQLFLSNFNEI